MPPSTLPADERTVPSVPSAESVSPLLAPPKATDRTFMGLPDRRDQYIFKDRPTGAANPGVITVNIPVSRVVGSVNSDGTLANADSLIANGVIGSTATLMVMAFDVDRVIATGLEAKGLTPETVTVKFNGESIGTLRGGTDIWFGTRFVVDIKKVRFPIRAPLGQKPVPAINTVIIEVDSQINPSGVLDAGQPAWAVAVDWASLSMKAMSPVVLIHGWHETLTTWTNATQYTPEPVISFKPLFESLGIPFDIVSMTEPPSFLSNSFESHGRALAGLGNAEASLPAIARRWGVDSLHLVAHSKGGLDAREFLARYGGIFEQGTVDVMINPSGQKFTVLSLTTIGAPHQGTALADFLVMQDDLIKAGLTRLETELQGLPLDVALGAFGGFFRAYQAIDDGLRDMTTGAMANFNDRNVLPPHTVYLAISGDADQDGGGTIQLTETRGLFKNPEQFNAEFIYTKLYQFLRDFSVVRWRLEGGRVVVVGTPTTAPQGNDTIVTHASAKDGSQFRSVQGFVGPNGRNHQTLIEQDVATMTVLPQLRQIEQTIGDFR